MTTQHRSTERFSSRVENYIKYRPHYPDAVVPALERIAGLTHESIVADIGSGTGFSAELFLTRGCTVYGVEPNKDMREAGERYLSRFPHFHSLDATAEATTLPDHSIDVIVAGQAFHWFAPRETREEWKRILHPAGWVALLWNDRDTESTPFLRDYEALLQRFGTDYNEINHRNIDRSKIEDFFQHRDIVHESFEYVQHFDYAGVKGRLLSSSYVPAAGEPGYEEMLAELRSIFDRHAVDGYTDIRYTTLLYAGHL